MTDPERDPTRTEDVEADLERTLTVLQAMPVDTEFAEKMVRELVGELEEAEAERDRWKRRDEKSWEWSEHWFERYKAARRREDRLEERAREVIMWGFDHEHDFPSSDWQETVEHLIDLGERIDRLRSALDSREDEGVGSDLGGERADSPSERDVDGGSRAPDPADANRCPECGHLTIDHGSAGCSECDDCDLRDDEIKWSEREVVHADEPEGEEHSG